MKLKFYTLKKITSLFLMLVALVTHLCLALAGNRQKNNSIAATNQYAVTTKHKAVFFTTVSYNNSA